MVLCAAKGCRPGRHSERSVCSHVYRCFRAPSCSPSLWPSCCADVGWSGRRGKGGGGFLRFCCREARCRASCAHRFGCTVLLGVENRFAKVCCVFRCISRFAGSFERAKRVVGAPCIIHQRQAGQGPCGCLPLLFSPLNCPSTRRFRLGVVYRESVVSRRQSCTGYKVTAVFCCSPPASSSSVVVMTRYGNVRCKGNKKG